MTAYFVFQSFASKPYVFVSANYGRSTKPTDAVYVWLENVNSEGFEVCISAKSRSNALLMSVIVDPFKLLRAKRAFPLNETATELY